MNTMQSLTKLLLLCLAFMVATESSVHAEATGIELSVSGSISSQATVRDDTVKFWITLANHGKADISGIRLIQVPAGYELEQLCVWDSGQSASCNNNQPLAQGPLIQTLAPGQTRAVSGKLKAGVSHDSEALPMVIAWKGSPEMLESSTVLSLGVNQVQTKYQRAASVAFELFKSLAIPAALAILGLFLNNLSKKRDELRAQVEKDRDKERVAEEKKREELRHENERIQALRSETWKQMLPISHNYAAKYYLPASSAAERAVQSFQKSNFHLAFFYFLMVLRRMTATTDEIGGFYFKDLRGERLAAKCIKAFRQTFLGEETDSFSLAMRESADLLKPNGTYENFKKKFCSEPGGGFVASPLQDAWTLFDKTRLDVPRMNDSIRYLTALYTILDYESNRPYEYWYDSGAQVAVDEETEKVLAQLGVELQFAREEIAEYVRQMKQGATTSQ